MRETVRGKYVWVNGEVYEGGFKADHLDGQGTFLWASGRLDLCTYAKGKATGDGVRRALRGPRCEEARVHAHAPRARSSPPAARAARAARRCASARSATPRGS